MWAGMETTERRRPIPPMSLIRLNKHPSGRQLAVFGLAWLGVLGVGGWVSWHRGRTTAAEITWALAALIPAAGLVSRGFLRLAYLTLSYLTYPIGYVASYLVLAATYYLALAPIGLTMRLFGHDPLSRRFEPGAKTYWAERPGPRPPKDYFRQS